MVSKDKLLMCAIRNPLISNATLQIMPLWSSLWGHKNAPLGCCLTDRRTGTETNVLIDCLACLKRKITVVFSCSCTLIFLMEANPVRQLQKVYSNVTMHYNSYEDTASFLTKGALFLFVRSADGVVYYALLVLCVSKVIGHRCARNMCSF